MTWTINMSAKELEKKSQIERALDKRITQKETAETLGISERQIRRLIQQYRKEGAGGLVSKKRGVPSNRKISAEVEKQAIAFMTSALLRDFGLTLMTKKLEQVELLKFTQQLHRSGLVLWFFTCHAVYAHFTVIGINRRCNRMALTGSNHLVDESL